VVAHLVPGRHVEPLALGQLVQGPPAVARAEQRVREPRHEGLPLAHGHHVREGRQRLGVEEERRPSHDDQRIARPALGRPQRDAGQAEHVEDVQVVVLERHREGHHVELAQRGAAVQAGERRAGALELGAVHVVGEERALADDVRLRVQELVDTLEAEVGHPHEVEVRPAQRDPERAPPVEGGEGHLRLKELSMAIPKPTHGNQP
jgi:hypothetical protein